MGDETGIETLLDLDGQIIDQKGGYWVKFEVWRVDQSQEIPHGIRYSLTMHEAHGTRIMGCPTVAIIMELYQRANKLKPPFVPTCVGEGHTGVTRLQVTALSRGDKAARDF